MITIAKIFKLILFSALPMIIYESAVIGFWLFTLGTASWKHVHEVAWAQDLVVLIPLFSALMFMYGLYRLFTPEESKIDIPRYERPKHERYTDMPNGQG